MPGGLCILRMFFFIYIFIFFNGQPRSKRSHELLNGPSPNFLGLVELFKGLIKPAFGQVCCSNCGETFAYFCTCEKIA